MKILVIEDDTTVGEYVRRGLDEAGYHVDLVGDGDEGLRRASGKGSSYDMMVLDLRLPKLSGIDVLRTLRDRGVGLPVLVLTAQDSVDFKVQALRMGADDYVTKPFAFEELLARLRALMRREQKNGHANRLQVADLVLDLKTHQVRRGDAPIELTAREFALLEFLMRHPNQVLTQAQIAERVWDYNFEGTTNRVAVYISYLRDKIDEGRSPKLIQTVYGVGYRLSG
jgi:DNA-binding response OmpR family regulator